MLSEALVRPLFSSVLFRKSDSNQNKRIDNKLDKSCQKVQKLVLGNQQSQFQNVPFCPISASGSNFNPRNTQCIPLVKIFAFLDLEQN
jgi:hypothetical protein